MDEDMPRLLKNELEKASKNYKTRTEIDAMASIPKFRWIGRDKQEERWWTS